VLAVCVCVCMCLIKEAKFLQKSLYVSFTRIVYKGDLEGIVESIYQNSLDQLLLSFRCSHSILILLRSEYINLQLEQINILIGQNRLGGGNREGMCLLVD
jgi:hypothetical protein